MSETKESRWKRLISNGITNEVAESEGFEPPDQLPGHRISSAARSTTPATFQKERYCFSRSEEGRKGYLLRSIIKPGGDVMKLRVNKI